MIGAISSVWKWWQRSALVHTGEILWDALWMEASQPLVLLMQLGTWIWCMYCMWASVRHISKPSRQISYACAVMFDLKMLSDAFFLMVLKKKKKNYASYLVGPDNVCYSIKCYNVTALQASYMFSFNFTFHLSGDFNHKHFAENVCYIFMLNSCIFAQIEFPDAF